MSPGYARDIYRFYLEVKYSLIFSEGTPARRSLLTFNHCPQTFTRLEMDNSNPRTFE